MRRLILSFLLVIILAPLGYYGVTMYLPQFFPKPGKQVPIRLGSGTLESIRILHKAGVLPYPQMFRVAWILAGRPVLQAGLYDFQGRVSQENILQRLIHGQSLPLNVVIIPGWNLSLILQELRLKSPYLNLHGLPTGDQAAQQLAAAGIGTRDSAEGWLFPDSYRYVPGTSALSILKRAYQRMNNNLQHLWSQRAPGLPLKNPYQALILASVVQKEGAPPAQQAHIAAVFLNRLRQGMPLQSDPTVIYALGKHYQGHLTPQDMHVPSAYNTYLHGGLPPTPIAMPGMSSLQAVLHPSDSHDLYFIAQGNAYHYSTSYRQHIEQIKRYLQPTARTVS
ncbi:endolytic transglycosylase MltG [Acidithiobacillus sp.]|uniref:endolytic transglycosylase MltG n=1 Tax=Acidithiobacillus sp. TaxID=1872118 RepID=UPI0026188060|nr:endolytic transglycosylase MltG [Acidithiobacillus sp.]MDD2749384.1 endolytic transglycosylase MltG [Acidithiobacillus sp.]MDD5279175.1 endolytic transglycosylase MltG [Acidithiobacillus sp.]